MAEEYRRPEGLMKAYAAEDRAMFACPAEPLDGTLAAAQAYVDRITRSAWWQRNCPPSWLGDEKRDGTFLRPAVIRRILVTEGRGKNAWAGTGVVVKHRGRYHPRIRLGTKPSPAGLGTRPGWVQPPIREPWIILHEVAHILAECRDPKEIGHGRSFRTTFLDLVRRFLGPEHARALREGYKAEGLTYRRAS